MKGNFGRVGGKIDFDIGGGYRVGDPQVEVGQIDTADKGTVGDDRVQETVVQGVVRTRRPRDGEAVITPCSPHPAAHVGLNVPCVDCRGGEEWRVTTSP